jgi:hypothetical protein
VITYSFVSSTIVVITEGCGTITIFLPADSVVTGGFAVITEPDLEASYDSASADLIE